MIYDEIFDCWVEPHEWTEEELQALEEENERIMQEYEDYFSSGFSWQGV